MDRVQVVVTGIGCVLPGCDRKERFWEHISQGQSQLAMDFDPSEPGRPVPMGRIRDFEPRRYLAEFPEDKWGRWHREQQLLLSSIVLARNDAGLDFRKLKLERVGLFDGTSRGNFAFWSERLEAASKDPQMRFGQPEVTLGVPGQAVNLAAATLGVRGPVYTLNGSCSAGAIAIGHAFREVQAGRVEVAFGSGHDVPLLGPIYQMYRSTELLNGHQGDPREAVRPYVGHSLNVLSEAAVTLVLESREHAERRGATILAELAAYEYGNTGRHPTDVDHTGERPAQLIEDALCDAEVSKEEIRFVVGHGNAAPKSDRSELEYMRRVFGERTAKVPLVSMKPIYGHAMGASSAISLAAATLMVHHRFIAPTINVDESKLPEDFDHVPNRGRADQCGAGLVVNFGIGGQNTALLLRRVEGAAA